MKSVCPLTSVNFDHLVCATLYFVNKYFVWQYFRDNETLFFRIENFFSLEARDIYFLE